MGSGCCKKDKSTITINKDLSLSSLINQNQEKKNKANKIAISKNEVNENLSIRSENKLIKKNSDLLTPENKILCKDLSSYFKENDLYNQKENLVF